MKPDLLDLSTITRSSKITRTQVLLAPEEFERTELWITCGESQLRMINERERVWRLSAYLVGATDFEHDSAFAFTLPLLGVQIESVDYGRATILGWIGGDGDTFRVPPPGYNPVGHADAHKCDACKGEKAHAIVPLYVPPKNPELYAALRGRRVEIITGSKPQV